MKPLVFFSLATAVMATPLTTTNHHSATTEPDHFVAAVCSFHLKVVEQCVPRKGSGAAKYDLKITTIIDSIIKNNGTKFMIVDTEGRPDEVTFPSGPRKYFDGFLTIHGPNIVDKIAFSHTDIDDPYKTFDSTWSEDNTSGPSRCEVGAWTLGDLGCGTRREEIR